jgi:Zn-dependent protease with chaperone function
MDTTAFEARAARLELEARRQPRRYRARVVALALAGYAYLIGMLIFLLALLAGALASLAVLKVYALKLALPIGGVVWAVLKAMWVRIDEPKGEAVTRAQAPELFSLIDHLRHELKSPPFHRVLITREFNASVQQLPRLGILGWHRNYLMLGLPLMKTLTREQFTAVLAHEFGHLAGGHGRLGNWIYRLRMSWAQLQETLEKAHQWGSFAFRPFVSRFIPYFTAYSFPLARSNEFEADATSARLTSPRAAAEALTSVSVIDFWLGERYWPGVHRLADLQPAPSYAPYASLGDASPIDIAEADRQAWLEQALRARTTAGATHPSLSARLEALGEPARLAPPAAGESADWLLGAERQPITDELDRQWRRMIEPSWSRRHQHCSDGRQRLAQMDAAPPAERSFEQALDHAQLVEEFGAGADTALEEFRALQSRWPESAAASLALGERLLRRDEAATGIALLERAVELDANSTLRVAETLREHYWRSGDQARTQHWHERLLQAHQHVQQIQQERQELRLTDTLEPHQLGGDAMAALVTQLRAIKGLHQAYLVRKQLQHHSEPPLYVLGHIATPWWKPHSKARSARVQAQIIEQANCPTETLVVSLEGYNVNFGRKLRRCKGARIL